MTSQYRHRRTSNPATPAPNLEPGEIAVNTANRQISVGDAASATLGVPKPLLAIRFFDTAAIYAIGDVVTNAGQIWRALVINGPGAFNAAQWEPAASQVTIASNPPSNAVAGSMWWDSDNGMLYVRYNDGDSSQWVQATAMPVVDTTAFVLKAGDTMTGDLLIQKSNPALTLDTTDVTMPTRIYGKKGGLNRWQMQLGVGGGESGGNIGSDFGLYRYDDAGALIAGGPVLGAARVDGRVAVLADPTAALGVATKQYVDAGVFNQAAYSGIQINGSMEISQENGTSVVAIPTGTQLKHLVDGVKLEKAGTSAWNVQQVASVFPGFVNALKLTVTTAQPAIGADNIVLQMPIEGYRFQRVRWGTSSAIPVTIGFWVKSSVAGNLLIQMSNSATDAFISASATAITTANVAQYITATFPATTGGAWLNTNGLGGLLRMYLATSGAINVAATVGNTFEITGVVVLPGTQAPTAAQSPLLMRPYDQELLTCKRYWYVLGKPGYPLLYGYAAAGGNIYDSLPHPVEMRSDPTVIKSGTWIVGGCSQPSANSVSKFGVVLTATVSVAGTAITYPGDNTNFFTFDARL